MRRFGSRSGRTGLAEVDEVGGGDGHAVEVNLGGKFANAGFESCDGIGHSTNHDAWAIGYAF